MAVAWLAASALYPVWGYSRVFSGRPWLGALGGAAAIVLGSAAWLASIAVLLDLLRSASPNG